MTNYNTLLRETLSVGWCTITEEPQAGIYLHASTPTAKVEVTDFDLFIHSFKIELERAIIEILMTGREER